MQGIHNKEVDKKDFWHVLKIKFILNIIILDSEFQIKTKSIRVMWKSLSNNFDPLTKFKKQKFISKYLR